MFRKLAIVVLVWATVLATSRSAAFGPSQESELQMLSDHVRASLEAQQTEFTTELVAVSTDYLVQRWAHGAERVVITLRDKPSYGEAIEALKIIPGMLAGSVPPSPLPSGLMADGFMYVRHGRGGTSTLYFVKGKRLVTVTGPSEQIAVWFAFKVAEQLPS